MKNIQLNLNKKETDALAVILIVVGGSPLNSIRKDVDSIIRKLKRVGIDCNEDKYETMLDENLTKESEIMCKDKS